MADDNEKNSAGSTGNLKDKKDDEQEEEGNRNKDKEDWSDRKRKKESAQRKERRQKAAKLQKMQENAEDEAKNITVEEMTAQALSHDRPEGNGVFDGEDGHEEHEQEGNGHEEYEQEEYEQGEYEQEEYEEEAEEDLTSRPPTVHDERNFRVFLREWAAKNNIARTHLTELLKGIKHHVEVPFKINLNVPADYRALMETPRKTNIYISPAGTFGNFAYVPLKKGIESAFKNGYRPSGDEIKLKTFVDGFVVEKKRNNKFWAILNSIFDDNSKFVFMTGLYCGKSNPMPFDDILVDFVEDFNSLQEGFNIEGYNQTLKLAPGGPFIMDMPAKADCTCAKPSGYFSCDRCSQRGQWLGTVVFPEITSLLRTNLSFRNREQMEHHQARRSSLEKLNIDMVQDFPADYMHLACLGAMKRLLHIYLHEPGMRIDLKVQPIFFGQYKDIMNSLPSEFRWTQTNITKHTDQLKAKEYRFILLYSGIVLLKEFLPEAHFTNFLRFSLAIRIFCSENLASKEKWISLAEKFLTRFVAFIKDHISAKHLVRAIHGLLHLGSDVRRFGSLENFSAFYFESYLGRLGRLLNGPNLPLEQLTLRYLEQEAAETPLKPSGRRSEALKLGKLKSGSEYETLEMCGWIISTKAPNNKVLTKLGKIAEVRKIFLDKSGRVSLAVSYYGRLEDLFNEPIASSLLDIVCTDSTTVPNAKEDIVPASDCRKKMFHVAVNKKNIFIPLLHF